MGFSLVEAPDLWLPLNLVAKLAEVENQDLVI